MSSSDSAIAFARPPALSRLPPLSLVPGASRLRAVDLPPRSSAAAELGFRRACRPQLRCGTETRSQRLDEESEEEGGETGHGPQVYETHMEDAVYCGTNKVEFLRAAFGTFDDVIGVPILRAVPMTADADLSNADELRGKIAVVVRGSSRPTACSFVEKALRVEDAGAVGVVVVNTEDSMISPGDSAREGGEVSIPVVGIRSSDVAKLIECEGAEKVSLTFKPIAPLTAQQRKHLRALSSIWAREGRLSELKLDASVASESVLASVDAILEAHELVLLRMDIPEEGGTQMVSLQDIEDVVDVATVIADHLGGTVVHITDKTILLYRQGRGEDAISLPKDGEVSDLDMDLGELAGSIKVLDFQLD